MPKAVRSNSTARRERRHNPLSEEYSPTAPLKQKAGKKRKQSDVDTRDQDSYVDSKASRRILDLGQALAAEDDKQRQGNRPSEPNPAFSFESRFPTDVVSDEEAAAEPGEYDDEEAWGSDEEVEEIEIDPDDLETFNRFNPSFDPATLLQSSTDAQPGQGTNLTNLILEKIAEHEAQQETEDGGILVREERDEGDDIELPEKVVEAYTAVGSILSRYKSGRLPKPFKILPTLPNWELLLNITRPENWTPNAVYEATKIFSSSRPGVAQLFNREILLPRVREDIRETHKLNVHLYKALKKALYKPAAFFRGLLFDLVESGTCTLREATIVGSVIARVSIPVLHSASALYRLCEISTEQMFHDAESAGACNIFIRTLLEKKYALPFQVVDELVFYFLRFKAIQQPGGMGDDVSMNGHGYPGKNGAGDPKLPVLWHQCLLAFAQRYKNEITEDQREAMLDLLLVRGHKQIGPEVRRELLEGRNRGVVEEPSAGMGGDDTMIDI